MSTPLHEIGRLIKVLQYGNHRALDQRFSRIGTTLAQWDALRAVGGNPGASSHDLAELTFQTDQSFGALAVSLLDKGMITRTPGKGRMLSHVITDHGRDVLEKGNVIAEEFLKATFSPLSEDELAQFHSMLVALTRKS